MKKKHNYRRKTGNVIISTRQKGKLLIMRSAISPLIYKERIYHLNVFYLIFLPYASFIFTQKIPSKDLLKVRLIFSKFPLDFY